MVVSLVLGCGSGFPRGLHDRATGEPPHLPKDAWTLVALPDTQTVVASDRPEIFYEQTAWIAAHATSLNIKYVVHEGDITNDSTDEQWAIAAHGMRTLDGVVPYALAPGNHDYPGSGNVHSRDLSKMDQTFPLWTFAGMAGFRGTFEPTSISNSVHVFEANGEQWLILALEFGPRDEVLAWADGVLYAYPDANAIVVTHAYLFVDGTRFDHANATDQYSNPHEYNDDGRLGTVNDGQEMWNELFARHASLRFVLCGHMHAQALRTSYRDGKPRVHQLLADYQHEENGGNGYLRLMTFFPDGTVRVRTYSPYLSTYRTEPENDFALVM